MKVFLTFLALVSLTCVMCCHHHHSGGGGGVEVISYGHHDVPSSDVAPSSSDGAGTSSAQIDWNRVFNLYDHDKNGKVSKADFDGVFLSYDKNQDGVISEGEFMSSYPASTGMSELASLYVFYSIDVDKADDVIDRAELDKHFYFISQGDDTITLAEFTKAMGEIEDGIEDAIAAQPSIVAKFNAADANNDGSISALETLPILAELDANGDGKISLAEFVAWCSDIAFSNNAAMAEYLFNEIDLNGDGFIAGISETLAFFWKFDLNGDLAISRDEFDTVLIQIAARVNAGAVNEKKQPNNFFSFLLPGK